MSEIKSWLIKSESIPDVVLLSMVDSSSNVIDSSENFLVEPRLSMVFSSGSTDFMHVAREIIFVGSLDSLVTGCLHAKTSASDVRQDASCMALISGYSIS